MTRERDPIDEYLNEVCWAMGGALSEQQAVRDELRAHISEESRELQLQGVPSPDALNSALSGLGPPADVGRAMRSSRGTPALRRPLLQPEGAIMFGRRNERRLPAPAIMLALLAMLLASAAIAISYAWPA